MPHAPLNARAWFAVLAMAGACVLGGCGSSTPPDDPATGAIIRDGAARFTVLTPTLIRLEYADDERFEDGATQTVLSRELRSEEHTSELQSLMRTSYAVFCLKKKTNT